MPFYAITTTDRATHGGPAVITLISSDDKTDIPHPDTVTHPDATVDLPAREPGMEPGTSTWADTSYQALAEAGWHASGGWWHHLDRALDGVIYTAVRPL